MANPEHLEILKQGVDVWNKWRDENQKITPNLLGADFRRVILTKADLTNALIKRANLTRADLTNAIIMRADLSGADLSGANLTDTNLRESDLTGADLKEADFTRANLNEANLANASLWRTNLMGANLAGANLTDANLWRTNLTKVNLNEADLMNTRLFEAKLGYTILANLNLNNVVGLEGINHLAPSPISTDTIQLAQGNLPEVFLRGCGLSDFEIEDSKLYNPDLSNQEINDIVYKIYDLRAKQSIQISPLFISYSHKDDNFAATIDAQFNNLGVRYWRDVHHGTAGPLEEQIDLAIRHNPTVLLVLSENSIKSDWVEHEVRTARDLTKELGRHVLCPVALDDSWKSSPWPKRIMEQVMEYNILDFSQWEDKSVFDKQFKKLLDGLDLFYK